jgi:hypothetical protein
MDEWPSDAPSPMLEAGTVVILQYNPDDRTVCRVTQTIDLQTHIRAFAKAYKAGLKPDLSHLHGDDIGDAWASDLTLSGALVPFCDSQQRCASHTEEHDYARTINVYPPGVRLGWKGAPY